MKKEEELIKNISDGKDLSFDESKSIFLSMFYSFVGLGASPYTSLGSKTFSFSLNSRITFDLFADWPKGILR